MTPTAARSAPTTPARAGRGVTVLWTAIGLATTVYYFQWLLSPGLIAVPVLFALLLCADLFNGFHALSFWATCLRRRAPRSFDAAAVAGPGGRPPRVDVLIPTYSEPAEIVGPTLAAARAMRGAELRVYLLDDGGRPEMAALAREHGAHYIAREGSQGAKSGNVNHALAATADGGADLVALFDCDHVPAPEFLERTLGYFVDERLALLQTPQVYGNAGRGALTEGSAQQQAIFFGPICEGRDGYGASFCCGTNFVARREALAEVGGFPEDSITEDIVMSTALVGKGWDIGYHREPLSSGLGPEDAESYVSQQLRWATGCIDLLLKRPGIWRPLSWTQRWQYFVATSYWLTGWTILVYLSMPVATLAFGWQPLTTDGGSFVQHFLPYFLVSIINLGRFTVGDYGLYGLAMNWGSAPIHVRATLRVLTGRIGGFTVTSKTALAGSALWPLRWNLGLVGILVAAVVVGTARAGLTAATVNNIAFAALNGLLLSLVAILAWSQARGRNRSAGAAAPSELETRLAAGGGARAPASVGAPRHRTRGEHSRRPRAAAGAMGEDHA